jgi:hypothetical protein
VKIHNHESDAAGGFKILKINEMKDLMSLNFSALTPREVYSHVLRCAKLFEITAVGKYENISQLRVTFGRA